MLNYSPVVSSQSLLPVSMKRHQKCVKLCDHRHCITHRAYSMRHCHRVSWQLECTVKWGRGTFGWDYLTRQTFHIFFVKYVSKNKQKKVCSLKFIECNLITYTSIHSISLIWFTTCELVICSNEKWLMCRKHTCFSLRSKISLTHVRGKETLTQRFSTALMADKPDNQNPPNRFQKNKKSKIKRYYSYSAKRLRNSSLIQKK